MSHFLEIDGSVLEGGGQVLRMSIAFSAILGKPVRVNRIRYNRSKPGLAAQHLKGIQLVAQMCQAKTKGLQIGSTEIEFVPGKIRGGHYLADCVTAGSISLLLQVALPCALLADSQVTLDLKGGTNADMAPQVDYMTEVFRPILEKLGGSFDFDLHRRGYFPKGGGHVTVTVNPVREFNSLQLTEQGQVDKIFGWSFVAGTLPIKMAYEMCDGAKEELGQLCRDVQIECYKEAPDIAPNNCSGIILVCTTSSGCVLGSAALGGRGGARGEGAGAGAALRAGAARGACLDEHAQDQMIIYMALAAGASAVRVGDVTMHTQTAMHVAHLFSGVKFNVVPCGGTNIIECTGLGFSVR